MGKSGAGLDSKSIRIFDGPNVDVVGNNVSPEFPEGFVIFFHIGENRENREKLEEALNILTTQGLYSFAQTEIGKAIIECQRVHPVVVICTEDMINDDALLTRNTAFTDRDTWGLGTYILHTDVVGRAKTQVNFSPTGKLKGMIITTKQLTIEAWDEELEANSTLHEGCRYELSYTKLRDSAQWGYNQDRLTASSMISNFTANKLVKGFKKVSLVELSERCAECAKKIREMAQNVQSRLMGAKTRMVSDQFEIGESAVMLRFLPPKFVGGQYVFLSDATTHATDIRDSVPEPKIVTSGEWTPNDNTDFAQRIDPRDTRFP